MIRRASLFLLPVLACSPVSSRAQNVERGDFADETEVVNARDLPPAPSPPAASTPEPTPEPSAPSDVAPSDSASPAPTSTPTPSETTPTAPAPNVDASTPNENAREAGARGDDDFIADSTNAFPTVPEPNPLQAPAPDVLAPGTSQSDEARGTTSGASEAGIVAPNVVAAPEPTPEPTPTPTATSTPTSEGVPSTTDPNEESGQTPSSDQFSIQADGGVTQDFNRGLALANGKVVLRYGEFTVRGDRGVVDYNTNRALLTGNLTVSVRGRTLTGRSLTFDIESGKWSLSQLATTFEPEFFTVATVLEPVYVTGGRVEGQGNDLTGSDFTFSTCDRGHYYLRANRLDFYRDRNGQPSRIALRQSALYLFRRKILPLPAYVVSLTGARSRRVGLLPQVGQNDTDGFFAKLPYDVRVTNRYTDTLLIDALQKRGLGLGFVREFAGAAGLLSLYAISGKGAGGRQLDAKVQRSFRTIAGVQGTVNYQLAQNNSSTGFGNSNSNLELTFARQTTSAQSQLLVRQGNSSGSGFSTGDLGLTFTHAQRLSRDLTLDANSIFSNSTSTGSDAARSVANRAQLTYATRSLDAFARIDLFNDLTRRNGRSIAQLSRLPEIGFTSNTDRLKLPLLSRYLPGEFSFGVGDFIEPRFAGTGGRETTSRTRIDLGYTARQREVPLLTRGFLRSRLLANGRFQQDFYSDSSAKYDYSYNLSLDNAIGPFTAQLNYVKARSLGFTPFLFDFSTPSETFDATLAYQPSPRLRANVSFGRDVQNGVSYDAIARLQIQPSKSFYASLGTNYSPQQSRFGDVIGNFHFERGKGFLNGSVDLGVRYSPNGQGLAQANVQTSVFVGPRTQIEALAGYSGFTKQFDQYQFRVTRDLHDFNLFVTYDNFRKQLRFDLALKAFPFFDTRYGLGANGQGFSPSIGGTQ